MKRDKFGTAVTRTAVPVAPGPATTVALSVFNSIANKARDNAWKIGDQAMKKGAFEIASGITRGCFE